MLLKGHGDHFIKNPESWILKHDWLLPGYKLLLTVDCCCKF